jgi:hypothetical protein
MAWWLSVVFFFDTLLILNPSSDPCAHCLYLYLVIIQYPSSDPCAHCLCLYLVIFCLPDCDDELMTACIEPLSCELLSFHSVIAIRLTKLISCLLFFPSSVGQAFVSAIVKFSISMFVRFVFFLYFGLQRVMLGVSKS